jgi:hypothetical protein
MFLQEQYTKEMKKIHGANVDPKWVPFSVVVAYAMGGGALHGWYVKISIVFG